MTCSRLFILGALLTFAPPVTAQPAPATPAKAPAAKAAKAPKAAAQPAAAPTGTAPAAAAQGAKAGKAGKAGAGAATPAAPAAAAPAAPPKYPVGLPEAKVRIIRHQVEVAAAAERRAAQKEELVYPGQKLNTGANSSTEIDYADGTRLILSENSEVSLYGVAPPPPPPGKKAKPAAFKPGNTTLLRGELVIIVPAPPPPPPAPPAPVAPVKGKGKAKVAKVKKAPPPKPAATAIIATPLGKVVATPGSEVRIAVEPTGLTRVAVYNGQAELQGKGKPVVLAAGVGSSVENVKTPPKPGAPLPPPPVVADVQQLTFTAAKTTEVKGTFAAAPGSAPPAGFRIQVARDAAFDHLQSDVRVAATETKLLPQKLGAGDHYVRVSAISAEGVEGKASAPTRVRVARVTVVPGSEGKRAAVAVEGKDLYCSLDGAPLTPVLEPLPLTPARDHLLRCATVTDNPKPEEMAEQKIAAAQSGPLVARLEPGAVTFTPADPKTGVTASAQRQVTLVLSDAAGNPLPGAAVRAEGVGGVQVGAIREGTTPGSYVATVTWPTGQTGHSIRYHVNDVETYEGRLPDALPPVPEKPKEEVAEGESGPPKRFAFELGLFPSAAIDTSRLVFSVGAGIDIGGRIRLPYGALAFALRPQYEYFPANPAVAHVILAGLPITYRIRKDVDHSDIVPYIGVLPQFIADYSFLVKDGTQVSDPNSGWRTSFGIGGLVGTEFRVRHGAVFVEGGYRYVLLRNLPEGSTYPTLSGIFANLGFRATF